MLSAKLPGNNPPVLETKFLVADVDLDKLLAGDAGEFEKVVVRESGRLFSVIRRIVREDDEARSVMQETFLQAWQRLDTFRRESRFTTWLYAIGINLARASVRKSSRLSALSDTEFERLQPAFDGDHLVPTEWNPARMAETAERRRIVRDAIDRLPEDYRIIITLRDIEELPTAEAAGILAISDGAARVRLHRARQALRSLLAAYFEDSDSTVSINEGA